MSDLQAPLLLTLDDTGLVLINKLTRESAYVCELQPRLPPGNGWIFHVTRGDLSDIAEFSHLVLYWSADEIHVEGPDGQPLLDVPRKVHKPQTSGSRGAEPQHVGSWKGQEYIFTAHLRLFGKQRVLREQATGTAMIRFQTKPFSRKKEGVIDVSDNLHGEDLDVMMAAFLGFYMFDERRDSMLSYSRSKHVAYPGP